MGSCSWLQIVSLPSAAEAEKSHIHPNKLCLQLSSVGKSVSLQPGTRLTGVETDLSSAVVAVDWLSELP